MLLASLKTLPPNKTPKGSPLIAALPKFENPEYTTKSVSKPKSVTSDSYVVKFTFAFQLKPPSSALLNKSMPKSNSSPLFSISPIFVLVELKPVAGSRGLLIIKSSVILL